MRNIIIKYIMNKYASDMGNYYDYIQGHEEDIANQISDILNHGTLNEKIQLLKGGN